MQLIRKEKNGSIFLFRQSLRLELGAAGGVCNVVDLNTMPRVDLGVDLDTLQNPDIRFIFFHEDFVHHIRLIDRVEDVGRRLGSELCGTDEQHRDKEYQRLTFSSIFKDSNKKAPPIPSSLHPSSLHRRRFLVVVVQRVRIRPHQPWHRVEDEGRSHVWPHVHRRQVNRLIQHLRFPLVSRVDVHRNRLNLRAFRRIFHLSVTIQFSIVAKTVQFYSVRQ